MSCRGVSIVAWSWVKFSLHGDLGLMSGDYIANPVEWPAFAPPFAALPVIDEQLITDWSFGSPLNSVVLRLAVGGRPSPSLGEKRTNC